ncbi:UNVERIFIED_CONTAM: hypothetical protein FKN15_062973 [Acipenser sinensis]
MLLNASPEKQTQACILFYKHLEVKHVHVDIVGRIIKFLEKLNECVRSSVKRCRERCLDQALQLLQGVAVEELSTLEDSHILPVEQLVLLLQLETVKNSTAFKKLEQICLQVFQLLPGEVASLVWAENSSNEAVQSVLTYLLQIIRGKTSNRDTRLLAGTAVTMQINTASKTQDGAEAAVSLLQLTNREQLEFCLGSLRVTVSAAVKDGVDRLAVTRALLTCGRKDILVHELASNGTCLLLDVLFPAVSCLCEENLDCRYYTFQGNELLWRVILSWLQCVKECLEDIWEVTGTRLLTENSSLIQKLTQLIWNNAESPVEGVSEFVYNSFRVLLEIYRLECERFRDTEKPLYTSLLQRVTALPWQAKAKYFPLCALIPYLGTGKLLQAAVKKALVRIRESCLACLRKGKANSRKGESTTETMEPVSVLSQGVEFVEWLVQLAVSSLAPGLNFQRKKTALLLLAAVLETCTDSWTPDKKKGQPPENMCALINWSRERGRWDFFTESNLLVLLGCLHDGTNEIRELTAELLGKFFPPCFPETLTAALLEHAGKAMCSPRVQEAQAGAIMMKIVYQKSETLSSLVKNNCKERNDSAQDVKSVSFLLYLLCELDDHYITATRDMLQAARTRPIHEAPPSFADMGNAIQSLISQGRGLEQQDGGDAVLLSEEHSLILTCCWVSLKEIGILLGSLVEKALAPPTASTGSLISIEDLKTIAKVFQKILLKCRHWGAVEGCCVGFTKFCSVLLNHHNPDVKAIPRRLLEQGLSVLSAPRSSSVTRRAAGLPMLILCIVVGEDASKSRPLLAHSMSVVLEIAGTPLPDDWDQTLDLQQVCAVHILQTLVRGSGLGVAMLQFATVMTILSLKALSSPCLAMRNAAIQLFSALCARMLGQRRSRDDSSAQNGMSPPAFFTHYPELKGFLLQELQRAGDPGQGSGEGRLRLIPSLHSVLTLLARLQPGVEDEARSLSVFLDPLLRLAGSPIYAVRVMAAKALVAMVSPSEHKTVLLRLDNLQTVLEERSGEHLKVYLEAFVAVTGVTDPERQIRGCPVPLSELDTGECVEALLSMLERAQSSPDLLSHALCAASLLLADSTDAPLLERWCEVLERHSDPDSTETLRLAAARSLQLVGVALVHKALNTPAPRPALARRLVNTGVYLLQDEDPRVRGEAAKFASLVNSLWRKLPGERRCLHVQSSKGLLCLLELLLQEFGAGLETLELFLSHLPESDMGIVLQELEEPECVSLYEQDEANVFAEPAAISQLLLPYLLQLTEKLAFSSDHRERVAHWVTTNTAGILQNMGCCKLWCSRGKQEPFDCGSEVSYCCQWSATCNCIITIPKLKLTFFFTVRRTTCDSADPPPLQSTSCCSLCFLQQTPPLQYLAILYNIKMNLDQVISQLSHTQVLGGSNHLHSSSIARTDRQPVLFLKVLPLLPVLWPRWAAPGSTLQ